MSITFVSGPGRVQFFDIGLPFLTMYKYYCTSEGSADDRSISLDRLVQGRRIGEGSEVSHRKIASVSYRPMQSELKISDCTFQQLLCFPAKTVTVPSKVGFYVCLGDGTYAVDGYHRDWGGCVEDATLTISYPTYSGHYKYYPKTVIPRGDPYEVWFTTVGDNRTHVVETYNGHRNEYDTTSWNSVGAADYQNGNAEPPPFEKVQNEFLTRMSAEYDADALHSAACRNAVNDLDVIGVNWYENLGAIQNIAGTSIKELIESITKSITHAVEAEGVDALKVISNAYLSKKYGIDNDLRDFFALRSGIPELISLVRQSELKLHRGCSTSWSNSTSRGTVKCSSTVYCQPFLSGRVWDDVLGITPSASNLWAVLPFSFAIDWILHCSDNLKQIEYAHGVGTNRWHVSHIWLCDKLDGYSPTPSFDGWECSSGEFHWSDFNRYYSNSLPDYIYDPPDYGLGPLKNHVFEMGAIALNAF